MTNEQRFKLLFLLTTDRGSTPNVCAIDDEWGDNTYQLFSQFKVKITGHDPEVVEIEAFHDDNDYDLRYCCSKYEGFVRDIDSKTLQLIDDQLLQSARNRISELEEIIIAYHRQNFVF